VILQAVTHSLACNFTSDNAQNLLVAKCTHLVLYDVTPTGLQPLLDIPIYGRIAALEVVRMPGETRDQIFMSTEDNAFCLLAYNQQTGEIDTKAAGDGTVGYVRGSSASFASHASFTSHASSSPLPLLLLRNLHALSQLHTL